MKVTDIAGNEIRPGSLILYAASSGYSPILAWGRVERVVPGHDGYHSGISAELMRVQVTPRITFRGIEWYGANGPEARPKLSTLSYPERIIVVPWEGNVPDVVRRLLGPDTSSTSAIVG